MIQLLAQFDSSTGWVGLVIQGGCLLIVAFGAHYILTKTIPNLIDGGRKDLADQRMAYMDADRNRTAVLVGEIEKQRHDFRIEISEDRIVQKLVAEQMRLLTVAIVTNTCPHLAGAHRENMKHEK